MPWSVVSGREIESRVAEAPGASHIDESVDNIRFLKHNEVEEQG